MNYFQLSTNNFLWNQNFNHRLSKVRMYLSLTLSLNFLHFFLLNLRIFKQREYLCLQISCVSVRTQLNLACCCFRKKAFAVFWVKFYRTLLCRDLLETTYSLPDFFHIWQEGKFAQSVTQDFFWLLLFLPLSIFMFLFFFFFNSGKLFVWWGVRMEGLTKYY